MSEKDEIGFRPVRMCPLCGEYHEVKYQYQGIDLIACSKMPEEKMMLVNEEDLAEKFAKVFEGQKKYYD